ncbi:MAG TPA: hypothetical protein VNN09_04850, partial [Candidatus Competibacteraceae bacterium]|nr:hypothetical protein [Candidatus Competibacteraceae bacterium]
MSQPPLSAAGTAMTPARRNRQRLCLLLLIALFLLPLLAASWLVGYWRPTATTNHGELLATARPVVPFTVTRSGGTALAADYLRRRWTLAYLGAAGECGQPCR